MKSLFIILLIKMACLPILGQRVAVEQQVDPSIFYIGLENYISIVAENCPCESLVIISSEGKILGDSCRFIYKTDTATNYSKNDLYSTEIKVFRKKGSELILLRNKFFRLKFVPDPLAYYGQYANNETVRNAKLLWASNITVLRSEVKYFSLDISFRVQNFKVSVIRMDSTILSGFINNGNWFNKELLKEFEKLKSGDKIKFYDINTKGTDGTHRLISPLTLFISESK